MSDKIQVANLYGANLEALKHYRAQGNAELTEAFQAAVNEGQRQLIGHRFPEINEAIEAGRQEARKELGID